jgi:hypothetical protein
VSTEFRQHGIPRNFLTSEVISAKFRRNSAKFRGIPRNFAGIEPEITSVFRGMPKCHFRGHPRYAAGPFISPSCSNFRVNPLLAVVQPDKVRPFWMYLLHQKTLNSNVDEFETETIKMASAKKFSQKLLDCGNDAIMSKHDLVAAYKHRHRGRCRRHRHSGVLYLSPVPDWVPLFWYRTGSGIGIFVHSGTGLTGCQTVLHCSI